MPRDWDVEADVVVVGSGAAGACAALEAAAAGGFAANRPMMRSHAPTARGGLPLATPGDDGSGIRLGTGAGGATAFLDRVSVWRFLSPPPALLAGVLVNRAGERICDESRYGAALGDAIVRHGGQAWHSFQPGMTTT